MIRSGELRHRVQIVRRNTATTNELGETIPADQVLGTAWAKVSPTKATEAVVNAENTLTVTHDVVMRFTPLVDHTTTLVFQGRRLDVVSVTDLDERHLELAITCMERRA